MRTVFLDFLASEGAIPVEQMEQIEGLLRTVPEPIGSIAFSYGMITGNDIDAILDDQRMRYRPFGEIAIERGLLTTQQVDTLLGIQRIRAATEISEALALAGVCTMEQVVRQLGRFLSHYQHPALCTTG